MSEQATPPAQAALGKTPPHSHHLLEGSRSAQSSPIMSKEGLPISTRDGLPVTSIQQLNDVASSRRTRAETFPTMSSGHVDEDGLNPAALAGMMGLSTGTGNGQSPGAQRPSSGYTPRGLQVNTNLANAFGEGLFSPSWQLKFQNMLQQEAAEKKGDAPETNQDNTPVMREIALEPSEEAAVNQVVKTFNYLGLGESDKAPKSAKTLGKPPRLIIPGTSSMRESGVMSAISPGLDTGAYQLRARNLASNARRSAHIPTKGDPFQILKSPLHPNGFRFGEGEGEDRVAPPPADHLTPTRSLWIGNIDPTLTTNELTTMFSPFGPIESLRVLPDKECAFVNYYRIDDAVRARDEMQGGRVGNCIVKVGFGKVAKSDFTTGTSTGQTPTTATMGENATMLPPTRALWVGNLSPAVTMQQLQQLFQPFGTIESCRILTHKSCGFVNFEKEDDAVAARKAMNGKEIAGVAVRIGFAKVPTGTTPVSKVGPADFGFRTPTATTPGTQGFKTPLTPGGTTYNYAQTIPPRSPNTTTTPTSGITPMAPNPAAASDDPNQVSPLMHSGIRHYFASSGSNEENSAQMLGYDAMNFQFQEAIPPCPEPNPNRRVDQARLREMRRKLDGHSSQKDVDAIFSECIDDVVDLSIDYFGNTVVQKLVERCADQQVLRIIELLAPHLAAIGINKHGTWVVQKVIDMAKTNQQIHNIIIALKPFTPPLLLDQFGNYVVQCCLRLGPTRNQFVFDAMHVKCWPIGQGRFGARAMRACLENDNTTMRQKKHVAIAIVQNALPLSTNANGTILLTWLLDSSNLPGRYRVLAPKFVAHLAHLCTHKLASGTIFKIINQTQESDAREMMIQGIFYAAYAPYRNTAAGSALPAAAPQPDMSMSVLEDVLSDPMYGVPFVQKVLSSLTNADEKSNLTERVRIVLNKLAQGGLGRPLSAPINPAMNPFLFSPYFAAAAVAAQQGQPGQAGQRPGMGTPTSPKTGDATDMYLNSVNEAFAYAQQNAAKMAGTGAPTSNSTAAGVTTVPPPAGRSAGAVFPSTGTQNMFQPYVQPNLYNNIMAGAMNGMIPPVMNPGSTTPTGAGSQQALMAAALAAQQSGLGYAPNMNYATLSQMVGAQAKDSSLEDQLQGQMPEQGVGQNEGFDTGNEGVATQAK